MVFYLADTLHFITCTHLLDSNASKPSCDRCQRLGRQCTYERFNNSVQQTQANSRTAELELQVATLQRMLSTNPAVTPKQEINTAPEASPIILQSPNGNSSQKTSQALQFTSPKILTSQYSVSSDSKTIITTTTIAEPNTAFTDQYVISSVPQQSHWIFPVEVIVDCLQSYFANCNQFMIAFMHEKSFMASWSRQPRELVLAVCAIGAKYSTQYKRTLLLSVGDDPGSPFFNQSRQLLDISDPSFETFLTLLHLCLYTSVTEQFKLTWIYSGLISSMCSMLKLQSDPDQLELQFRHRWSVLEKDMRRRVWFAALPFISDVAVKSVANVKLPLPNYVFLMLTGCEYVLESYPAPPTLMASFQNQLETLSCSLSQISELGHQFLEQSVMRTDRSVLFVEATNIHLRLYQWKSNLPDWMNAVTNVKLVQANQSPIPTTSPLFWMANNLYLQYLSTILTIFKFSLIDLCTYQDLSGTAARIPYSGSQAFQYCESASSATLTHLSELYLKTNSDMEYNSLNIIIAAIHAGVFCSVVSKFGDTNQVREKARNDTESTYKILDLISEKRWKCSQRLLATLKSMQTLNSVPEFIRVTQTLMSNPLKSLEEHAVLVVRPHSYSSSSSSPSLANSISPTLTTTSQPDVQSQFPPSIENIPQFDLLKSTTWEDLSRNTNLLAVAGDPNEVHVLHQL